MRIVQFFIDHNLQGGENKLSSDVEWRNKELPPLNFYFFLNKNRNIVKVLAQDGLYTQHFKGKQTFEPKLHLKELLKKVGEFFGFHLNPTQGALSQLSQALEFPLVQKRVEKTKKTIKKRKAA